MVPNSISVLKIKTTSKPFWSAVASVSATTTRRLTINPSQKAAYTSSGKLTIEEVDVLPHITWKDGNFMFQNESLESVMNKLARWYDLDVFYLNEQTKNIHLSGMMTRYKEVSELFHYFEKISTARFIIKGRTVTVK